jgi:hypothetical protein
MSELKIRNIPLNQKETTLINNYLAQQPDDPLWIGSWLIYYLYLFYLFKKYNHTDSIYIENFDIYKMQIFLHYGFHNDRLIDYPNLTKSNNYLTNPYIAGYLEFIVNRIKNGCELLFIPLIIRRNYNDGNNEYSYCHKNILVYKKHQNSFEHFEPYGSYIKNDTIDKMKHVQKCVEFFLNYINENTGMNIELYDNKVTSLKPTHLISQYIPKNQHPGPQSLEFFTDEYTEFETNEGYCVAWSLLFIELSLKYPRMPINYINERILEEIVENIFSSKGISNRNDIRVRNYSSKYLALARNYCFYIMAQIELNFYFLFDSFVKEGNSHTVLIEQIKKIYEKDNDIYQNFITVIGIMYTLEHQHINDDSSYDEIYKIVENRYIEKHNKKPLKRDLTSHIRMDKFIEYEENEELQAMIMLNLCLKLKEMEKHYRKPPPPPPITRKNKHTLKIKNKNIRSFGTRYNILRN